MLCAVLAAGCRAAAAACSQRCAARGRAAALSPGGGQLPARQLREGGARLPDLHRQRIERRLRGAGAARLLPAGDVRVPARPLQRVPRRCSTSMERRLPRSRVARRSYALRGDAELARGNTMSGAALVGARAGRSRWRRDSSAAPPAHRRGARPHGRPASLSRARAVLDETPPLRRRAPEQARRRRAAGAAHRGRTAGGAGARRPRPPGADGPACRAACADRGGCRDTSASCCRSPASSRPTASAR